MYPAGQFTVEARAANFTVVCSAGTSGMDHQKVSLRKRGPHYQVVQARISDPDMYVLVVTYQNQDGCTCLILSIRTLNASIF
jgi:hypothetical protein